MYMRTPYLTDYTGNIGLLNASKNSGSSGAGEIKANKLKRVGSNMNLQTKSGLTGRNVSSSKKQRELNNSGNSGRYGGSAMKYPGLSDIINS